MQTLVLSFLSNDRPGLIEQISSIIHQHQGNWLESQMAQMSGKFTGIVEIKVNTEHTFALTQALQALSAEGISVLIESVDSIDKVHDHRAGELSILGLDRPGIVNEISTALASQHINVESFHSFVEAAPMSGEPLFKAEILIAMPAKVNTDELNDKFELISQSLDIEYSFSVVH
jgi:glycine cleavage system regulatory protein